LNQLDRAWSRPVATVTPSPSAASIPNSNTPAKANETHKVSTTPPATNDPPPQPQIDVDLQAVAEQIDSYLRSVGRELEFRVDNASGRTVISVRDQATGELVRQIPSEEALRLAESLGTQTAVLLDVKI